jgi:hypothetical protein
MHDHPQHEKLEQAFEKSQEEYHDHILMKPRFEDFRLQFQTPSKQVADKIPSEDSNKKSTPTPATKPAS